MCVSESRHEFSLFWVNVQKSDWERMCLERLALWDNPRLFQSSFRSSSEWVLISVRYSQGLDFILMSMWNLVSLPRLMHVKAFFWPFLLLTAHENPVRGTTSQWNCPVLFAPVSPRRVRCGVWNSISECDLSHSFLTLLSVSLCPCTSFRAPLQRCQTNRRQLVSLVCVSIYLSNRNVQ